MRKIVLFLAMALLVSSLSAQTLEELKTLNQTVSKSATMNQQSGDYLKSAKKIYGETWVKDSIYYYKGNGDEWELDVKSVVEQRDEYGNPVVEKTYFFDVQTNSWSQKDSIHKSWNAPANLTESISYAWNSETKLWSDTVFYEKYNEDNQLTYKISGTFHYNTNYQNANKIFYTYDKKGNLDSSISVSYFFSSKNKYFYDENRNLIEEIRFRKKDNAPWENAQKITYGYDNSKLSNSTFQNWNDFIQNWEKSSKSIFEYDLNGQKVLTNGFKWNSTTETWTNSSQTKSTYNNNLLFEINHNLWDMEGESWNTYRNELFNYDENDLTTQYLYLKLSDDTKELKNYIREDYFWSAFPNENSSVNEPQETSISLSPNPVQSILYINTNAALNSKISIYSVSGKLVKEATVNGRSAIDVSSLHPGIYFIHMSTPQGNIVKKIIKQ